MNYKVFLVICFVTTVYVGLGAYIFHIFESKTETEVKMRFAEIHKQFLEQHQCMTQEALHEYIEQVILAHSEGIHVSRLSSVNNTGNSSTAGVILEDRSIKWDFATAFLFCLTIITTIGYGNQAPKTWKGRLFCIFYAIVGIPMFTALMIGVGERLQIPSRKLRSGKPWIKNNPNRDKTLKTAVILTIGLILLVIPSSFVFTATQNQWTFLDSVYYTVITLTTIGFGDLLPDVGLGTDLANLEWKQITARILIMLWILVGMSLVALIISEISSLVTHQGSKNEELSLPKRVRTEDIVVKSNSSEHIVHQNRKGDSNNCV